MAAPAASFVLRRAERDMVCKAIIPIAGRGRRMRPVTAVVPKALLPLVDSAGRVQAVVHRILLEAASAGITEAALIVSPGQQSLVQDYLLAAHQEENHLPQVTFITQSKPKGLGDAVLCAGDFAGDEPVAVLLGDHIHIPRPGMISCAAQVVEAFVAVGGVAMIGVQIIGAEELSRVGVARGQAIKGAAPANVYRCKCLLEKPDLATARRKLVTPGLPDGRYLAHCGIYVFKKEIFQCLAHLAERTPLGREIQLTDAQQRLLAESPNACNLLNILGRAYDVGHPAGYAEAIRALRGT